MTPPLDGITILDLTRLLPGPLAVMFLADMGADVIKIEETEPRFAPRHVPGMTDIEERKAEEMTAAYRFVDRNKRSICLNLKTEGGRKVFYKLAGNSDVVVEEFRPGVTKRLGVDYETLKEINPRIIYCAITGYGQDGPYRLLAGHDPQYESIAGILGITGTYPDGRHCLPGIPIGDLAGGGMHGAIGILLALMARERTGKGQFVDSSIVDALVLMLTVRHAASFFSTGRQLELGERPPHIYETKDGKYISISIPEPWFWERTCRALGLEEFITYHEAVGHYTPDTQEMREKRDQIISSFQKVFRTKTRDEWFRILWEVDTCVAPVYRFEETYSDPHVLHRKMIVELDHPNLGKVKHPGISTKLSETPGQIRSFAPLHGQHTEEILKSVGYTERDIEELFKTGAVK